MTQQVQTQDIGTRAAAEARLWLGTPYLHQASQRGAGCDCLGLIRGIWRALYEGAEPQPVPGYSRDWAEATGQELLHAAALRHLVARPLHQRALGDVLLFRLTRRAPARHLGLQSRAQDGSQRFIHAYSGYGVVENSLTCNWQGRLVGRFAFPAPRAGAPIDQQRSR